MKSLFREDKINISIIFGSSPMKKIDSYYQKYQPNSRNYKNMKNFLI
jgi:hypothetical protein